MNPTGEIPKGRDHNLNAAPSRNSMAAIRECFSCFKLTEECILTLDFYFDLLEGPRYVMLTKDSKPICLTMCLDDLPFEIPSVWIIVEFRRRSQFKDCDYPHFELIPVPQDSQQKKEWGIFMAYLMRRQTAAVVKANFCSYYIHAPDGNQGYAHCVVLYSREIISATNLEETGTLAGAVHTHSRNPVLSQSLLPKTSINERALPGRQAATSLFPGLPFPSKDVIVDHCTSGNIIVDSVGEACQGLKALESEDKKITSIGKNDVKVCYKNLQTDPNNNAHFGRVTSSQASVSQKNFVTTDPSYLRTLSQTHSGWIFGAIAELVDNSRDAHSNRLDIYIEHLYLKKHGKKIPVLSIVDDGDGMSHSDIVRMLSFGHKQTKEEDEDRIGRFGIGFKTGAMKLGRDALVLTQSLRSRSVAFLSQSYNENNDNIEIPIVSYIKNGRYMEIDLNIQSEELANFNLNAIKEYSPFNEYFLGEKLGLFGENGTGTQIFIWNLDEWGSEYTLEWHGAQAGESGCLRSGDILIRSRRIRSRPGQISQEVPLDYSLRAYLEIIFLNPRMKIYVQGSLVKSRPLAKTLSRTATVQGSIMARPIQLTLGMNKVEWERMNCGVFLYWNGRLIEAYKRVGSMKHNADMGRGVVGVADITSIMDNRKGQIWVLNNKQGFQDCEAYAKLEDWLGCKTNEYLDMNFDTLHLEKGDEQNEPDHSWVQCDKCRKWRVLTTGFDGQILPSEWFCFMPPFNGNCEIPEQQMKPGVVTVAEKRYRHDPEKSLNQSIPAVQKASDNNTGIFQGSMQPQCTSREHTDQSNDEQHLKKVRRGPSRGCRKS